jgi:hypothetical protein
MESWPPKGGLHITDEGTSVVLSWQERVWKQTRIFSTMPSIAYHLEDNPLFKRLKEKEKRQLSRAPKGVTKCIFVCDAGCDLLRRLNPVGGNGSNAVTGKNIIEHFVRQSKNVDMVVVFSPHARTDWPSNQKRQWHIDYFDKWQRPVGFYDNLLKFKTTLFDPYLDGYQAYSWAEQGMFNPQARGHYSPTSFFRKGQGEMNAKISARAIMEMLAGRLNPDQLKRWVTDGQFERILGRGNSISAVHFESRAPGEDDDYIIFEFAPDPNASPLRLPHQTVDYPKK